MNVVFHGLLITFRILLIIGMIYIGRELHRIRMLLLHGGTQIQEYLNVVMDTEEEPMEQLNDASQTMQLSLSNEEKQMLWNFDPEQLLSDVIGDIF